MQEHRFFKSIQPIWIVGLYFLTIALHQTTTLCLLIVCACFLSILIHPVIVLFSRLGIPPLFTALGVVILVCIVTGGLGFWCYQKSPQLLDFFETNIEAMQKLYEHISSGLQDLAHHYLSSDIGSSPIANKVTRVQVVEQGLASDPFVSRILPHLGSAFEVLSLCLVCPILTFFFFSDRVGLKKAWDLLIPDPEKRDLILSEIRTVIQAYFLGNLLLVAVSWPIFAAGFYFFHIDNFFVFAFLAALSNIIPFFGAFLAAFFPLLDLLSKGGTALSGFGLVALCFGVHVIIANFVTPKFLGSKVDLNAWCSTLALLIWGSLWGTIGLFLAVPITACLKICFQYSEVANLQWLALLMRSSPESTAEMETLVNPLRVFQRPIKKST